MSRVATVALSALLVASATTAHAQSLPTSQPNLLQIIREEVKVGHGADHLKVEAGWPAAYEQAKSPYSYLALASMTGSPEVWFVSAFESHAAMADMMKREEDPALAASLARLAKADGEHLSGSTSILASARKELSYGAYPDIAKQRFFDITIFRVRPGHSTSFEEAAKAYAAASKRAAPDTSFRVYEVTAGLPGPTFIVFSSVTSYAAYDKDMTDGEAIYKGMTEQERGTLQKFSAEGLISSETTRFRLDPAMSYVPKEVRAQDPAFWMPKPSAVNAAAKPAPGSEKPVNKDVKPAMKK
jgi:hypothetical protein